MICSHEVAFSKGDGYSRKILRGDGLIEPTPKSKSKPKSWTLSCHWLFTTRNLSVFTGKSLFICVLLYYFFGSA